jgi:hypothetical protein
MRKVVRTDKPYEAEGRWWLPGKKSRKKVPGIFRFDPESGGSLKLSGSLTFKDKSDWFERAFGSLPNYDVLLGQTIDGTAITLFVRWTPLVGQPKGLNKVVGWRPATPP